MPRAKLARGQFLAAAQEDTPFTYQAPTFAIPFTKGDYETTTDPLNDESIRGDDSVNHGVYPGPQDSSFDVEHHAYPDIAGQWLRTIGPDTVTAATATTLTANASAGDTHITTDDTIPAGKTIRIGTSAPYDYAVTGTPSGSSGSYTIPLLTAAGGAVAVRLKTAHASGQAVTTTTLHTFAQDVTADKPTWSLSLFDAIDYWGFPGCSLTDLAIKVDPKATVTMNPKFIGFPQAAVDSFAPSWNDGLAQSGPSQPQLGWNWTLVSAGGATFDGLTLDLTLSRPGEAIHASNGQQAPVETFVGAIATTGSLKAVYRDLTEWDQFANWTQDPLVAKLAKAVQFGGEALTLTMSQAAKPKWKPDNTQTYMQATIDLTAVHNSTDAGTITAALENWTTGQY